MKGRKERVQKNWTRFLNYSKYSLVDGRPTVQNFIDIIYHLTGKKRFWCKEIFQIMGDIIGRHFHLYGENVVYKEGTANGITLHQVITVVKERYDLQLVFFDEFKG